MHREQSESSVKSGVKSALGKTMRMRINPDGKLKTVIPFRKLTVELNLRRRHARTRGQIFFWEIIDIIFGRM
jgi:hypothetical protein